MYKKYTSKIWLIMRLTTVILIATLMQVSAAGFAQRITLKEHKTPLENVLQKIRVQSGYDFLFDRKVITKIKMVNIAVTNVSLHDALNSLLTGLPLTYTIDGKTVLIKRKEEGLLENFVRYLELINVKGTVLDEKGLPLPGASIRVKGTSKFTVSNFQGAFELPDVDENETMQISYVGYEPVEVKAKSNLGTISLKLIDSKLDEVMVIGYGTTTRRLSTGSTGQVTGDVITKQPVFNPILAMAGRVAGLAINQSAGYAGANVSVVIRGQHSLDASNAGPLYIIDGVPFESRPISETAGAKSFGATGGFSPLNNINPSDILSIDVLKDADATSIYGSRGGNGVILITTRKGTAGDTKVSLDISHGFGKVTNKIELLNTQEYLDLRRQAFKNDNITPTTGNAPALLTWDQNAYTNFPDLLIGKTSQQTTAGISISGGDTYNQFIFGGNLRKESTVFNSKSADKAAQFRLSSQHKSKNKRFSADVSVFYNVDNNTIPNYGMNFSNYGMPPNYPLYKPDGSLFWAAGFTNPLAAFKTTKSLKTSNFNANTTLRYTILPGLDIKATGGYNMINVEGSEINPPEAQNPASFIFPTIFLNNNYIRTYIVEPQLNYKIARGKSKFNILLGGTWQQTESVQPYWMFATFTDVKLVNSLGALDVLAKSSGYSDYRYSSGFGRVEYNWNDKFLLSGNIRRDGSSRFGPNNRLGTFGSVAGAWIFSQESFIKAKLPWLSHGNLRMSYGSVGNDKIPEYDYQSNYGSSIEYGPNTTLTPRRIANPYLRWEQTRKLDIAADFGFIKDRILFAATYYRNRVGNLLGTIALPDQTGFSSYRANLDALLQNKGVELELNTVNIANQAFRWTSSFNLTIPQNKLIKFPDLSSSQDYANRFIVGESINVRALYRSTGFVNGIATVEDVNGDGVITPGFNANGQGDRIAYGSPDPKYYGGFNNSFTYKNFQLDVFFQGIKQTATRGDLNFGSYPGSSYNIPRSMLDIGFIPSSSSGTAASNAYSFYTGSDSAVEDASFIRLKNVALTYNVPSKFGKKLGMTGLQIFSQGQNLLTITNYKGLDPETLTTQVPPLKMFTAGIRATF